MNDTYVEVPASAMDRYAAGYNASLVESARWNIKIKNLGGAGVIKSTMNDMLKYISANMGLVHTSIDDAIQLTHKYFFGNIEGIATCSIGLGWHMVKLSGTEYYYHSGGTYGFHTTCYFDPANKIATLVFTNSRAFSSTDNDIVTLVLNDLICNEKAVKIDPAILNDYIGTYHIRPNSYFGSNYYLTFTKEGKFLFAELTGNPKYKILPESPDKFFWTGCNSTVTFLRDNNGKVIGLDWMFLGNNYKVDKIK
jgi:hypothetical protein